MLLGWSEDLLNYESKDVKIMLPKEVIPFPYGVSVSMSDTAVYWHRNQLPQTEAPEGRMICMPRR